jgi:hypothetical protein
LCAHDVAPIPLELQLVSRLVQALTLTEKPPKMVLEGFYGERVPARGGCGLRG